MSDGNSGGSMLVSGVIAAVVGVVATLVLSMLMPPPWDLSRALICVAIASFSGGVAGFRSGLALGRRSD
jgi:hypothetical protein